MGTAKIIMATSTAGRRTGSPVQTRRVLPPATFLIIYPLTLVVGSLYSVISPTARDASLLTPTIATDINVPPAPTPPASPVNYFARKGNVFNLYFVKVGWAWTTLAFLALLLTQPYYTLAPGLAIRRRRTGQALLRYAIVTFAWFLTTQWFFGPAIIDRTFLLTGGKCERLPPLGATADGWEELKVVVTAAACKAVGGAWNGGYDVSGHVFMLVLASAFLAFEAFGATRSPANHCGGAEAKKKNDHVDDVAHRLDVTDSLIRLWAIRFVWLVTLLSWWMLFMTAIWFHTWIEKVCRSRKCYLQRTSRGLLFFVFAAFGTSHFHRRHICHVFTASDHRSLARHCWHSRGMTWDHFHTGFQAQKTYSHVYILLACPSERKPFFNTL